MFADGMSREDYVDVYNYEAEKLKKEGEYVKQNYNFVSHLRYSELLSLYKKLSNSDIVNVYKIGSSSDEKDIYSIEIGRGDKYIMLEGNVHAAEIASTLYTTKFAVDLVNKYESKDEEIINMLSEYKFLIVPSFNPDGYESAIFGVDELNNKELYTYKNKNDINFFYYKANANGVDINRNMPSQNSGLYYSDQKLYNTVSLSKSTKQFSYFSGDILGSEPEVKAVMYWQLHNYKNAIAYLSLHSSGRVIYNGKPNLSDKFNDLSNKCASIVRNITGYTKFGLSEETVGDGTDGTTTDFISELSNGFKYNESTGRLSTKVYGKTNNTEVKMCVLTIESLAKYTQDLTTIKKEYNDYKLENVFLSIRNINKEI
jgi:hypothetical protein